MANTIDRKINPEIPIVQESNRNEVYVPNASYTEPGVAGFFKTHFIVDDNGIVHLRKAPERAVSAVTYDSNTNTLIITFDDGIVQSIKLNDCACVDGVDLIVYDAFNVIEFKETSWTTLDAGKVLVISSALTGYDNDEIIAQLDKYNVVTTNINDGTVTSNYQTDNEYQIYKCTDGSLILFATEAFAGRFIILKREFAVQKNVASITYDDTTGILTIYYVTGGSVEVFVKTNMQFGEGEGSTQQIGAKATGKQAAAFGGRRYDKPTDESRRITEAKGGNAFAAGGSVIADGDFTAAFGKQTKAEQSASFAAGTNTQAGKTLEEYVAAGGSADDYAKSYAAAAVFGDGNKAKGYADFVAGNANESDGTSNTTVGGANKVKGTRNFTGGEANDVGQSGSSDVGNALTFGQHLKNTGRWNRVTFGQFNADDLAALFEIGNGTSDTDRVNIFVVKDNGAIYAGKLGKLHQGTRFQVSDGNSESDRRALIDSRHNGVTHIESYMSTLNGSVGNGNKVAASESGELKDIADPTDGNYPLLNTFLAGQGLQNKGRYNQIVFGQFNEFDHLALFQVGTGNSDTDRKKGFRVDFAGRAKSDTAAAGDEFYVRVADLGEHFAFPFADPNNWTIDYDATSTGEGLTITGNLRIYVKKGPTDATSVYHDIPNAKISIPIKAGDGISIDKADGEEWLVVKATGGGGGGTIDADTLNGLLSGGNGIVIDKNTAGDKVEVKTPYKLNSEVEQLSYGPYKQICEIERMSGSIDGKAIVGGEFRFRDGDSYYSFDGYHISNSSAPISKLLYADGPIGNVKTIGGYSIYGSGDIPVGSPYVNTSEIVDNVITLTNTSTLDNLVTQILAQKTKVVRASWSDNLARLLGTPPELTGPTISQYSVLFKTIYTGNQTLISAICICESYIDVGAESFIGAAQGASAQYSGWRKLNNYYPIGSIYMSTVENNYPSLLFGGTWEQIKDAFLLAAGDTYTAGSTGGSADAVVVSHRHYVTQQNEGWNISNTTGLGGTETVEHSVTLKDTSYDEQSNATVSPLKTTTDGVDAAGKNLPPYLAVCIWKRIA